MLWSLRQIDGRRCRARLLLPVVAAALAGCTTYESVHWGGQVPWEEARRAIYADEGLSSRRLSDNGRHVVMPGETVSELAERYRVRMSEVVALNGLAAPYTIYVGQVLRLPRPGETAPKPAIPVRPGQSYVVARGDNLSTIAVRHGVRTGDLVALNPGIDPDRLLVGSRLRLPAGVKQERAVAAASAPARPSVPAKPGPKVTATPSPDAAGAPVASVLVRPLAAQPVAASAEDGRRQRDLAAVKAPARSDQGFLWPVEGGSLVSRFGNKPDGRRNDGVNIAAPAGTVVRAAENGVVVYAGEDLAAFGRMLLVRHADGFLSAYAHNETLLVARGDVVRRGQPVAKVGKTGEAVEPQLHFEIRRGKAPVDPVALVTDGSIQVAQKGS